MFDNRITIADREFLEKYLNGYEYKTSGLSFSAQYMWRDINQFSWDIIGEYMCICGISHLELEDGIVLPFMFPPLTCTGEYDKEALRETIFKAKERFEKAGQPFSLRLVPVHIMEIISDAVPELSWKDDRPNYDYIYRTQDLIELKGRDYHSKKNHLNYFKKNYEYEYVELTSAMADDAMRFIDEFNRRKEVPPHEMELLKMEEVAMKDVFENIEAVGYSAGAIKIDGKIEAVALGGRLGKKMVTEHVEKANVNFRGLYQAINNEFCRNVASWAKYINREEDMGIPNLRKAKLSYRPARLLEKYIGYFKD
ncbi:MAG: phosphatidylglycerol lysyltransferase domain-containing protein [Clostridiales bacterium]|nr:phosphatidylglycerol lysyltransferase domain-containing protein [Clostridiales bacterium]MDY2920722.1 phosphatidylglycerol lysyltransferase domain-containing protein [Lentihominibacter sp.]